MSSVTEKLQNRLLSMSSRSPLINMDVNVPYILGKAQMLADVIQSTRNDAGSSSLRLLPKPIIFDLVDLSVESISTTKGRNPLEDFVQSQAHFNNAIHLSVDDTAMESSVQGLIQMQKKFEDECGVHPLCLGFGVINWADKANENRRAPLLLLPAKILKYGSEYRLLFDYEELMINASIVELLKQKFALDLEIYTGYFKDQDEFTDIEGIFVHIHNALQNQTALHFFDQTVLSIFNFSLFPIWNEQIKNLQRFLDHPLSGSVLTRRRLWNISPDSPYDKEPLCPLSADTYQKQAIRMAICGESYVLNGPPGTGKSQTIALIIANLMAQGKKVLFVSAKAVALRVVLKRLDAIGISDHCLMLSQDTTLSQVLDQVERLVQMPAICSSPDSDSETQHSICEKELLYILDQLHHPRKCGFSLYDLLDFHFKQIADPIEPLAIPPERIQTLKLDTIKKHESYIQLLFEVGNPIRHILGQLDGIGAGTYQAGQYKRQIAAIDECIRVLVEQEKLLNILSEQIKIPVTGIWDDLLCIEKVLRLIADPTTTEMVLQRRVSDYYPNGNTETIISNLKQLNDVGKYADIIRRTSTESRSAQNALKQLLPISNQLPIDGVTLKASLTRLWNWKSGINNLIEWYEYQRVVTQLQQEGLKPAVDAYENGMNEDKVIAAYYCWAYEGLLRLGLSENRDIHLWGGQYEKTSAKWKSLKQTLQVESRLQIQYAIQKGMPDFVTSSPEHKMAKLLRAVSTRRRLTIRALTKELWEPLLQLAPCWMMSPLNVSSYLDFRENMFDVVIFDEASQLPPEQALGALFRAKSMVVAGDLKQLPPTDFFSPTPFDETYEDTESILEEALALHAKEWMLRWHYRSSSQSLIEFSNRCFYNHLLLMPPAPERQYKHRMSFVRVEDGIYARGSTRNNPKEASAIVDEVSKYRSTNDQRTIGIITLNEPQAELIRRYLQKAQLQVDFVKTIESVQGDECDVVLISVGYGPDESGVMTMNFGAINQSGGWRRLNVAVTRAKEEMVVFCSFDPLDLRVNGDANSGVNILREFLLYAQGNPREETKHEPNAKLSFSTDVISSLKTHGFQCDTNIGGVNCPVDIAVREKTDDNHYALGIMLYCEPIIIGQNEINALENYEDTRMEQLTRLGWQITNVWITNWLENKEHELQCLLRLLGVQL